MEKDKLKNWKVLELGEVANITYGKDFRKSDFVDKNGYPVYSANGVIGYSKTYNKENETIVLGCRGSVGKIHLTVPKSYITHNCFAIEPKIDISNGLLKYLLESIDLTEVITGTAQPQITITNLSPFKISMPPKAEGEKIVAKLDAIMGRVNDNKQRLDNIPQILKRFKQSVIAAAVSGRLTEEWRKKNKIKEKWEEKKLGDIITKIQSGKSIRCEERPPKEGETGIVKVSAVSWGEFDENESKTITDTKYYNESYIIKTDDFLLSRANTSELIAAVVIVKQVNKSLMLSDKILRFSFNKSVLKYWILYCLRSEDGRKQIEEFSTGNQQSMMNISQDSIKKINIKVPSIKEQQEIVKRVSELFTFADKIEARYTKTKQQLDKLPQSILAKAFRGELII